MSLAEMAVILDTSKDAISSGPLGTVFGTQLEGLRSFQDPPFGFSAHVALPALPLSVPRIKSEQANTNKRIVFIMGIVINVINRSLLSYETQLLQVKLKV